MSRASYNLLKGGISCQNVYCGIDVSQHLAARDERACVRSTCTTIMLSKYMSDAMDVRLIVCVNG